MKNLIIILASVVILSSCEEVVTVDLPNSQTSLVVEGGILHNVNGMPSTQRVTLSTTQQFF